jgi:transposase
MAGAATGQHNRCRKEPVMARRKFTREFKISAVQLVNQQGYTAAAAARSLGVDPNCVRGWVGKYSVEPGIAPSGDGAVAIELQRLRKENARLLMERDILKKAAQFFAREQT